MARMLVGVKHRPKFYPKLENVSGVGVKNDLDRVY